MIIKIDMNSETALYEQIVNSVVWGIATGKLKPGEKMPTVRKLGVDLGINLHTVNKAYAILKQKGYLSAHRNMGAVVNGQSAYPADDAFKESIKELLRPLMGECLARGMDSDGIARLAREAALEIKSETEGLA